MIRLLIVDDHPAFRRGLELMLSDVDDIEVVAQAASGEEAVELAVQATPDVVLMDLRMPVMSGFEAAHAIRSSGHPDAASIPIIAMSADAFEEDFRRAKEIGMNGYVTKPIDPGKLFEALARLLK